MIYLRKESKECCGGKDYLKQIMSNMEVCEFEFHILQVLVQDLPWLGHIFYPSFCFLKIELC
jgi:hypothetical protein